MKKFLALFLVIVMVFAMTATAMAATDNGEKTITIANPDLDQTYTAYKIFDMTKTADGNGYAYTTDSTGAVWDIVLAYIEANPETNSVSYSGKGLTLIESTESNKWIVTVGDGFSAPSFAAYLNTNKSSLGSGTKSVKTTTGEGDETTETVTIVVTGAGYYFVDSTLGSLCALDSADNVTVYEKNTVPTLTKQVKEDSSSTWCKNADADFDQEVEFKLTVNTGTNTAYVDQLNNAANLGTGIDNDFVITDTLPAGMTYKENSITIADDDTDANNSWTLNTDYTVAYQNNILTITLRSGTSLALNKLAQNKNITITYTAILNNGAIVSGNGNVSTAVLAYNQNSETTLSDSVTVYTWEIPVFKYTDSGNEDEEDTEGIDESKTPLAGAKFQIKKDNNQLKFDEVKSDGQITAYKYNPKGTVETIITDDTGKFLLKGLDADTYTIIETEAPAGYNALDDDITVVLTAAESGNEGAKVMTVTMTQDESLATEIGVLNSNGNELPSTGGMGTTVFYIIGAGLMMAAVVVLVARKRVVRER